MNQFAQYYRVLGLDTTATLEEVKQAYRSLAKKWHPDRFVNQPELLEKARQEIQKINQAYAIIKERGADGEIKTEVKANSGYGIKTKKTAPEIHYHRGVEFAEAEEYDSAIAEFTQAIKIDSEYLKAYQYRGFILSKLGYELRADADLKKAAFLKIKQKDYSSEAANKSSNADYATKQTSQNWQIRHTLLAHQKEVSAICLSKDNRFFVSGGRDGCIKLWQTRTGQAIAKLSYKAAAINSLTLSNNNKILITGNSDSTIGLWNLEEKKLLQTLSRKFAKHYDGVIAVALDSRTNTLISGGADNLIKIWNLDTAREIREIACSSGTFTSLAINHRKGYFCHGGLERQIRIRETATGKVIRSLRGDAGTLTLAFSLDGKFLAAGQTNCQIQLWNMATGKKYCTLIGHRDRISSLAFSAEGKTLLSGSCDNTIKLWDIDKIKNTETLHGHKSTVSSLCITSDNKTIISGSHDRTIKIWQHSALNDR